MNGLKTTALGAGMILAGSALAYGIQTSWGNVEIQDVRFTGTGGQLMSAHLYVPRGVSQEKPAPGILAVHGYINSRESQADFALEFARRGYVVLNMDQAGHGYSQSPAFANGYGGPAGLKYLRSLDIVDPDNIGLEGHSMGGWTILSAAAAIPDGYKAMVLEGSSTGSGRAPEGSTEYPRNLALVFSQYDEFAPLMWEVDKGSNVAQSAKLQRVFGTDSAIELGRVYGNTADGTARVLYNPATTHPGNHLSREAIGHAISWFDQTLSGAQPLPVSNQIWPWKEAGTALGWIGFVLLVMGTGSLLMRSRFFAPLAQAPLAPAPTSNAGWWLSATVTVLLPVLTFFPFFRWAGKVLPPNVLWPQSITNQIMVWAVLNALISLVLYLLWNRRQPAGGTQSALLSAPLGNAAALTSPAGMGQASAALSPGIKLGRSMLLALGALGSGYLALLLSDFFFKSDFRFWFVGLKLMDRTQFGMFLAYLLPFLAYTCVTALVLQRQLRRGTQPSYVTNALLLAGGFFLFLAVQYGTLFATGRLFTPSEPLNVIVAIQFLPILLIVSLFLTHFARLTGRSYAGAIVAALFLTWYIVAGQATQLAL